MSLPNSFTKDGYTAIGAPRKKHLMIGSDGWPNSGKTEFAWSAPEPILSLCLDRGYEASLDNATPPSTRQTNIGIKVVTVPLATQLTQKEYVEYWKKFHEGYLNALSNPDARTVHIDGDSDSWELQRLAEFGRLTQVPPIAYANANAARRALYARAWDSGKIVIFTNKLKDGYESKLDKNGNEVRVRSGKEERQGFPDQDYLFHMQLRHFRDGGTWGVRIMRCKANTQLEGLELRGEECNLPTLLQVVYPNISLKEWGY